MGGSLLLPSRAIDFGLSRSLHRSSANACRWGLHLEGQTALEGQAWHRGPVIISWADVVDPQRSTPHNLVVHEFSHQLDMLDDDADGIPPLPQEQQEVWSDVNERALDQLRADCASGRGGVLDCYGCENPAEFFAVSSEAFFEAPDELAAEYPELFEQLRAFYRSDPRIWLRPA